MANMADLQKGEQGCVCRVVGDDPISLRLMEMGVVPGATVQLIGFAPLGDPIEYQVQGYRLSLRRDEAKRVEIETTSSD